MKHFMYLLIMAAVVCCTATAFATDFADDTFGILNEKQKKALNELDISSELKKADAAADAQDFDKAREICQKLLKQSDLSSQDKSLIQAKLDAVENKRSDYVAQKRRDEERKQAEALAQTAREEESQHAALIEKSRIESEQERQRLLNAKGYLSIAVSFKAWLNMNADEFTVKVHRIKDIFGEPVSYDSEREVSSGSPLFVSGVAGFGYLSYGLYEVKVTAYLDTFENQRKVRKRADRRAEVIVNSDSILYQMVIREDGIEVSRIK